MTPLASQARTRLAHASDRNKAAPRLSGVRLRAWTKLGALKVYIVDGEKLRNDVDIDFTSGGNGARYSYCPRSEIWIDECLGKLDRAATLLHEVVERRWMLDGLSYDEAHDMSSAVEIAFRKHRKTSLSAIRASIANALQNPPEIR